MAFGLLWITAICLSLWFLMRYETTPGAAPAPPRQWPGKTNLRLDKSADTLIMLVHPQCPCTRASISELSRIMSKTRLQAYILCIKPKVLPEFWTEKSEIAEMAKSIPNVEVIDDSDGAEAKNFNATTSGYVLLYDCQGRLLFNGGITPGRGQAGDNAGADSVVAIANGETPVAKETEAFGCPLFNQSRCVNPSK